MFETHNHKYGFKIILYKEKPPQLFDLFHNNDWWYVGEKNIELLLVFDSVCQK